MTSKQQKAKSKRQKENALLAGNASFRLLFAFFLLLLALCLLPFVSAKAQISVQSLSEVSYGKLPRASRDDVPAYYNDLSIEFRRNTSRFGAWLAGVCLQSFASPELNKDYNKFTQRYAEVDWSWGRARAGHFFAIFGRGLALRSFELPGFIYESQVFRERHTVTRDLDGWKISLTPGPVNFEAITGVPVDPLTSPSDKRRRNGKLGGVQISLRLPAGLESGAAYFELRTDRRSIIATRFLNWTLASLSLRDLSAAFYCEYATLQGNSKFGKLDADAPHALYLSSTLTFGAVGASVEYKDYRDFGLGVNDPPSLVREHAELLLNRATHVLLPEAERGWQAELTFAPQAQTRMTANWSEAKNDFGIGFYKERYLAFEWLGDPITAKFFVDGGRDDIHSEKMRFTSGVAADYHFPSGLVLGGDLQWQRIRRAAPPVFAYHFTNLYAAARLQGWRRFSGFVQLERSTDPDETATVKNWPGCGIGWQPASFIDIQLFAGKRRGGRACDHGYCLEVLPFEGVEMRLVTHW